MGFVVGREISVEWGLKDFLRKGNRLDRVYKGKEVWRVYKLMKNFRFLVVGEDLVFVWFKIFIFRVFFKEKNIN